MTLPYDSLVHDWNCGAADAGPRRRPLAFLDESLRDGLQSPSVANPAIEHKVRLLHLMSALGIGAADLGLPGAGARAVAEIEALCGEIVRSRLAVVPACAARTTDEDLLPALEIMQRVGAPLEIMMFVGSSPIRCHVEGWTLDHLLRRADACISLAVRAGAPVTFVTEDTTRSQPDDLRRLYQTAVRAGAHRVCLADTAGPPRPPARSVWSPFIAQVLAEAGGAASGSTGTGTTIAASRSPSPSRPPKLGPTASTRRRSGSASGSATRRWNSSWSTPGCSAGRRRTSAT